MRILVAAENVFDAVGGGQTFYRSLLASSRHEFFVFGSGQAPGVTTLAVGDAYRRWIDAVDLSEVRLPGRALSLAGKAQDVMYLMDLAASVAGMAFDVVDIPDYIPFAALLPAALRYHGVSVGRVALSMHGTLSFALDGNWQESDSFNLPLLQAFEALLYRSADLRYGIGQSYIRSWQRQHGVPAQLLDIGTVVDWPAFAALRRPRGHRAAAMPRPDLCFVGRHEKCKGPDLFLDLCGRLPRGAYDQVRLIGPPVIIGSADSRVILGRLARNRDLAVVSETLARSDLLDRFANAAMVTVLPSRKDTFNLAALESLLAGCPTVISDACGVCDYLDEALPGVPYVKLPVARPLDGYPEIMATIENHDAVRTRLCAYFETTAPRRFGHGIDAIYDVPPTPDQAAAAAVERAFEAIMRCLRGKTLAAAEPRMREQLCRRLDGGEAADPAVTPSAPYRRMFDLSARLGRVQATLAARQGQGGGVSPAETDALVEAVRPHAFSGDRAPAFRLLAEVERCRGNDLLAATYRIRAFRLSGRCPPAELAEVLAVLRGQGRDQEAAAAELLFGGDADPEAVCRSLAARSAALPGPPAEGLALRVDRRTLAEPRASIVVSVYNAAGKVRGFVDGLCRLTERARRTVEVVFVDSNSTDDTGRVLLEAVAAAQAEGRGLSTLYLRSTARETIQGAWNRGIAQARGGYLALLGVDEANRPDAFDLMIDHLDRHPAIDWVQGNALVVEVDDRGGYQRDVMGYRRAFPTRYAHLLDCCAIGYVGALYRRSVHRRFGWYDAGFRGAGDVEFKNRVLPFIQVATLGETLGTFLNFPDDRVTQSAVAELEDLRAWYLFRSPGGLRYLFQGQAPDEAAALFELAMGYRKTYMDGRCTDVELACGLARYLRETAPQAYASIRRFVPGAEMLRDAFRRLDGITPPAPGAELPALARRAEQIEVGAAMIAKVQRSHRQLGWTPDYAFSNDNRSHQHHAIWPSRHQGAAASPAAAAVLRQELVGLGRNLRAWGAVRIPPAFKRRLWFLGEPAGVLDTVDAGIAHGWAWFRAEPDRTRRVELLVDGISVGTWPADRYRQDLKAAGIGKGQHCFQADLGNYLLGPGPYKIEARCSETGDELRGSPKLFSRTTGVVPDPRLTA